MRTVAVTGGIGSGKSTVCRVFALLGIPVFEADAEAKRLMVEDNELRSAIAGRFGTGVVRGGQLDRQALAAIVFNEKAALAELNALVHPRVRKAFHVWTAQQKAPYAIMEAAILAETGGHKAFDTVVVVTAPEELRIERVRKRDGVAREAVLARMANQAGEEQRLAIAHHVVVNDDQHMVIPQVLAIHEKLVA